MRRSVVAIFVSLVLAAAAFGEERFPPPDFRSGYTLPATQFPVQRTPAWAYLDMGLLAATLSVAAWLVLKKRSRRGMFWLTVFSVAYFGFYRKGCVCSVGSIQNVATSLFHGGYALPWMVAVFFLLPLIAALFFGRVFCAGVCPLGAIQDLVLLKPVKVPAWLEAGLGLFAYFYLGLAVLFAGVGSEFVICRWDPFVSFFRLSGTAHMVLIGGTMLVLSMFVGRTYCRFICPYGVLLRLLSPFSKWRVSISPDACVDCRLCEESCPFGAIRQPTRQRKPMKRNEGRTALVTMLALTPVLVGAFAGIGWRSAGALARTDATVRLAQRIWQEEQGQVTDTTDEGKAWRNTGESSADLYGRADAVKHRFAVGSALVGVWMGLVIGVKLVQFSVRRQRTDYTAHPGACVACARCYRSCPVEEERRKGQTVSLPVLAGRS